MSEQEGIAMVNVDKYYSESTPSSMTVWVGTVEEGKELVKQFKEEWGHIFWELVCRENSEGEKETTLYVLKLSDLSRAAVGS
ncbi:MAG: hypothetical protein OEV21_04955 [Thermoplasmata archaeon]|nr:hypothetical protein [Thermoplasmata archaeon]